MADNKFSYEWGDPALHVEFASAARRDGRDDAPARAVELFAAPDRPARQPRRDMRIGMRAWGREVIDGRR